MAEFIDTIYEDEIEQRVADINEVLFEKIPVGKELKTMQPIPFIRLNIIPADANAMDTVHEMIDDTYNKIIDFYDEYNVDVRYFDGIHVKTVAITEDVKKFFFFKKTVYSYLVEVEAHLMRKPSKAWLDMIKEYKKSMKEENN